jgi:hypothetical protein
MIASLVGPMASADDPVLKRMRRSRLSIHLTTPHVRRWLLVQLVSIPVEEAIEDGAGSQTYARPVPTKQSRSYQQIIDDYQIARTPKLMM